ncbi:MAG: hypothetical protein FJ189_11760 [Gammaproteobacteria bacterium]|nr:hypothetical protein [Gammaproteobacteria bacterium]
MRILSSRQRSPRRERLLATTKKGFYGLLALIAAALVFAFDVTWPILEEVVITVIEFGEQELEHLFGETLGFGHYYGQVATAWTGLFLFVGLLFVSIRRGIRVARETKAQLPAWREHKKEQVRGWWQWGLERFNRWWQPLSLPRKIAAGTAAVLIAVPLAWVLAVVLTTLILALFGF